jgi:hypothetical protein
MPREIISYAPGHDLRRQLIAADPAGLKTLAVSIARNQGVLEAGTFIDSGGQRALIASQVEGFLAAVVDSDFPDPAGVAQWSVRNLHFRSFYLAAGANR